LGHDLGDELLVLVAARLKEATRAGDLLARFGGDEFVLLLEGATVDAAGRAGERLIAALESPFKVGGREFYARASIGVAVSSGEARSADVLMRNADVAMYRAKMRGKARFEFFEPEMRVASIERLEFEAEMTRGLEHGEFVVHYQPIVTVSS